MLLTKNKIKKILIFFLFLPLFLASCETQSQTKPETQKQNTPNSQQNLSSVAFAKKLTIGWNLGNTLDADTETGWGAPVTTEEMIKTVKAAGFKTIRIPVSWSKHVDSSYKIESTWINRVKTVVDYAYKNDMNVILNVHHDNYSDSELKKPAVYGFALSTDTALQKKSKEYLAAVWKQIAEKFADYDERLVFEVLNEPRAVNETFEWEISDSEKAKTYCDIITAYENVCISTIRNISGNQNRFIMVPGYAASGTSQKMLKAYTMPSDSAKDKLILSTHAYSPYEFAMYQPGNPDTKFDQEDKDQLDSIFSFLKTNYVDKKIGVVMGEASATNKGNLKDRELWFSYYFSNLYKIGIPTILWDNFSYLDDEADSENHGYFNRKELKWYFPTLIENAMKAVNVKEYKIPESIIPSAQSVGWDETKAVTISAQTANLGWNTSFKLELSNFKDAKSGSILKIAFAEKNAKIKIINGSWNTYSSGTIVSGVASSEGTISCSKKELLYVLTKADADAWKTQDIFIAGQDGKIIKVQFQK